MNIYRLTLFLIGLSLFFISCSGKGDDSPPEFSFKTQSGYTYEDDTVAVNSSIKFGVKAKKAGAKMETYTISVKYDGGTAVQPQPPLTLTGDDQKEFSRDTTIVTRNVPGTEEWIFNIRDKNGNSSTRQIKLKVE